MNWDRDYADMIRCNKLEDQQDLNFLFDTISREEHKIIKYCLRISEITL